MEKDLNLTVSTPDNGVITILHGEAPKPMPTISPKKIVINGDIYAPLAFALHRAGVGQEQSFSAPGELQTVRKEYALFTMNMKKGKIVFNTDPNNPNSTEITGEINLSQELEGLDLNNGTSIDRKGFIKLLKNYKPYISGNDYNSLIRSLQNYKSTSKGKSDLKNDDRGNKEFGYTRALDSNIQESFKISIPLLAGGDIYTIDVYIIQDEVNGQPVFELECLDIHELVHDEIDDIMTGQLSSAFANGFLVLRLG